MNEIVKEILTSYDWITGIKWEDGLRVYNGDSFICIFSFNIHIIDEEIPVILGVPLDWDRSLFSFYISNYKDLLLIPHLEDKGKLCLFELEGVMIEADFEGLLHQSISRLKNILEDGLTGANLNDFINEFDSYWTRLPGCKLCISYVVPSEGISILKFASKVDADTKHKKDSFVASNNEKNIQDYDSSLTIKNGIYIKINSKGRILPPDWRMNFSIDYLNSLLSQIEDKERFSECLLKTGRELFLFFDIDEKESQNIMIAVYLLNANLVCHGAEITIDTYQELVPCGIRRRDREYLLSRGGIAPFLSDKRILIIGCGSIGGYLADQLAKFGISNLTLVDNDILSAENVCRHLLGFKFVGFYKTTALKKHLESNLPGLIINTREDRADMQLEEGGIDISNFDVIFSTVGNHNFNRWLNNYILTNHITVPVIYLWNEALGIGGHAAIINYEYDGCYNCFIGKSDGIYDKTSYCERGQHFQKKYAGCNSTYIPYNATLSIKTVLLGIEILDKYFAGEVTSNFLLSQKGDDSVFTAEGFMTSERYKRQASLIEKIEGKDFKQDMCICSSKEKLL